MKLLAGRVAAPSGWRAALKVTAVYFMLAASAAHAGTLTCTGRVQQINYHSPDKFLLQLEGMDNAVQFCSPKEAWSVSGTTYTTSAEACRALIAVFLSARAQDKTLMVWFDGDEVPTACNSWGSWRSANVRFFLWVD